MTNAINPNTLFAPLGIEVDDDASPSAVVLVVDDGDPSDTQSVPPPTQYEYLQIILLS